MALRFALLGLVLFAAYNTPGWRTKTACEEPSKNGNDMADVPSLKCIVSTEDGTWHAADVRANVYVEFEVRGASELSVKPSLHLVALPKATGLGRKEYWAPFALARGASTKASQKLKPGAAGKLSVRMIPGRLLWAPTKSSVWPSKSFGRTVPPGRYALQAQAELSGAQTVYSNEVLITVVK